MQKNKEYIVDEAYDKITFKENQELYQLYIDKLSLPIYHFVAKSVLKKIKSGQALFNVDAHQDSIGLSLNDQVKLLLKLGEVLAMGRTGGCDLTLIGGTKTCGAMTLNCDVTNWVKDFHKVYILDKSSSGLYIKRSVNLLDLLKV